jgi:hypothetical protein
MNSVGSLSRRAEQVSALSSDVLTEAKLSTGTWSLATYSRVTGTLAGLLPDDVRLFLTKIIEQLLASGTPTSERYKLAQICTMCRQKFYPVVAEVLMLYNSQIQALIETIGTDPLAPAVANLLRSLCEMPPQSTTGRIRNSQSESILSSRPTQRRTLWP